MWLILIYYNYPQNGKNYYFKFIVYIEKEEYFFNFFFLSLDSRCMFLMDTGPNIIIFVGSNIRSDILKNVFGVDTANQIHDSCYDLPRLETTENKNLHSFINLLNEEKPFAAITQIIR